MTTIVDLEQKLVQVVQAINAELDQSPDNTIHLTLVRDLMLPRHFLLSSNVAPFTLQVNVYRAATIVEEGITAASAKVRAIVDMHDDRGESATTQKPMLDFPVMSINPAEESTFRLLQSALANRHTFLASKALLEFSKLAPAQPVSDADSGTPDTQTPALKDNTLEGFNFTG